MGAHFAGWPVASPIRPVPGVGCRGVCVCGGGHGFYPWLACAILSCLALLLFTLAFEAFLALPNSGCSIRFRSYAYIYYVWPDSGAMKKYNYLFYDSTRFCRFDFRLQIRFRFHRLQCIFSDQSVPVQIRFRFQRFRLRLSLLCVRVISQMCFKRQHRHFRNAEKILIGHWRCIPDAYLTCNDNVFFWLSIKNTGKLPNLDFWSSSTDWTYH